MGPGRSFSSGHLLVMGVLAFYIVNRSGGLVYNKDFGAAAPQMSTNAHLQLASTFFGYEPVPPSVCVWLPNSPQ